MFENKMDMKALFRIGYGLYVVTSHDGKKDNGLIVNTVIQVTSTPEKIAVTINKQNYSHDIIKETGIMNVNCLTEKAPFAVFEAFGFVSGRNTDKFANCEPLRSENGLVVLPKYINSFMSLKVEDYIDLGTHGMFICSVTAASVISDEESMTYAYYHKVVKGKSPKNAPTYLPEESVETKAKWVCGICGHVYEGEIPFEELPADFVCPLCKQPKTVFEKK